MDNFQNVDFSPLEHRLGEIFKDYMKIELTDIKATDIAPPLNMYSSAAESTVFGAADGKVVLFSDDTLVNSICTAFSCVPGSITAEEVLAEVLNILLGNVENLIRSDTNRKLNFMIPKKSSIEDIKNELDRSRFCITFKTEVSSGCCIYIQKGDK